MTACERRFSLGCVFHTDGACFRASVNAPHDFIIGMPYVANASECSKASGCTKFKDGFFPRSNGFYRKHFRLPASWAAEAAAGSGSSFRLVRGRVQGGDSVGERALRTYVR